MKINKSEIIFLIRSYNEIKRLPNVIEEILTAGYKNIMVVDDGSTDGTGTVLQQYSNLLYVTHPFNRGGWAAQETWFEYLRRYWKKSGYKYVVTFDADGQHDIADIKHFIKAYEKYPKTDIVFGSRFIVKTDTNVPLFRKIILKWWILFTYILSHIYLTDSHNGYRMIRISVLKHIQLTMNGMEYASEMIEQISKNKLQFREVPVNIRYDDYSLMKGQKSSNAFRIAFKMIFSKFFK